MSVMQTMIRSLAGRCVRAAMLAVVASWVAASPASAQDVLRPPGLVPRPPANVPQGGGFNLFGGWNLFNPQRPPVEQAPAPKKPPPEPEGVVYDSADAAMQGKKPPPEKFVLVLGDSLGAQLAQGLADAYVSDRASTVIGRTEEEFGLLPPQQPGGADILARLPDAVAAARPGVTLVVLGSNDLRPIRDGDQMVEPLTDRWNELYGRRLDEVFTALRQKAGAVIVVGLAPVANGDTSAQYERLNDVLKTHAARAGLTFVSLWDGFVDEEGKFAPFGAAVDGQRRRLRLNDGVRFTKAGARKLAFFTQKDITRLLTETRPDPAAAAGPGARPVMSLTDGLGRAAATLAGGATAPVIPAAAPAPLAGEAARVLRDGGALPAVPGRADDHSWPPKAPSSQP